MYTYTYTYKNHTEHVFYYFYTLKYFTELKHVHTFTIIIKKNLRFSFCVIKSVRVFIFPLLMACFLILIEAVLSCKNLFKIV